MGSHRDESIDSESADSPPTDSTPTVCPNCSVGCALRYDAEHDRATTPETPRVNRNGRLCPRGINAFEPIENRLRTPLVRVDGDLRPASWETALSRVEESFTEIRATHGPDALAFFGAPQCTNEENYLLQKLARGLGTNNVDNRARICHRSVVRATTARFGLGATTNSFADLREADAFLVVGANPAARQPIAFNSYVRPAVSAGATLVHVDPQATRTTRTADVHLAPRPGEDALVATLLAAVVVEEGLVDRDFLEERTTGAAAFEAALREVDVADGARRAGVDPDEVRRAARAFGAADRACVVAGTGAEADDHEGTDAADALLDLLLLTGNVGRRGSGMVPLRGLANEQGANDAGARPHTLPGYAPVTDEAARERVAAEWGTDPPSTPGLDEPEAVRAFGEEVRGVFVLGENPAVTRMDTAEVARGFRAIDCLVVQDVAPSETTAFADVVLPASTWFEKAGTVTNLDRQVQRVRPVRRPVGEARRDFDVLRSLGERLTDLRFDYDDPRDAFAELTRVNPYYEGLTYEGVGDGGRRWPVDSAGAEVSVLHRDRFANGKRRAPFVGPLVQY